MSVYSCKSLLENVCSRDVGRFYLVWAWINFFRRFAVWDFWNVLKFLLLIEIFIWILSLVASKRWNFPENFDFKGNIVAKFLLKGHFLPIYNNMTTKQQINHRAIQEVLNLHNGVFHSINLCCILLILLYHLPCVIR